ncbi:MAG TPA: 50S ribosomal protein L22 [Elusimicrobiota bacterium]|jgi:large subunit ribosomal protein L22|nr:50S ribosomal protein L22 [Elusimicrobiota bacterium]
MEATAYARFQRFGTRKVAQVLTQIRGKSVARAQDLLPLIPRKSTVIVVKALKSAAANLQVKAGKKLDPAAMYVKAAWVGQGPMQNMKRVLPAPQGRAYTFKRKVCHLTMVVSDERK